MKLSLLLMLPASLTSAIFAPTDSYNEHLHLKTLPGGHLFAGFNFTATTTTTDYTHQHFRLFPRALGEILQHSNATELHLRFTLGRWDEECWGPRLRNGQREGGTGVELWAWIGAHDRAEKMQNAWGGLVNSLSGLFCSSLNFIDETKTAQPVLSFEPEGNLRALNAAASLLHGILPHEVVCTENLTPFLKLLPCKGKAGIGSLLDGHKIFDANWQTMSIDVRPVCENWGECVIEIEQTVDMVLDISRSVRPRDNPIPRPPPIEEIDCDESKAYKAQDTCYPKPQRGEMAWSLSKIFGEPVKGSCHLNHYVEGDWDVKLEVPSDRTTDTIPDHSTEYGISVDGSTRFYILPETQDFDIILPQQARSSDSNLNIPPLYASRQMTGYGQESGGMHAFLRNPHPYPQQIVYFESLPWFLRPYMHTLRVEGANVEKMYYTPAIDRKRGSHLELLFEMPAESTVDLTYDLEKAILRYTEYPPDANRGFDIPPAVIRALDLGTSNISHNKQGNYLRTTSLLLPLPTPDFSMPYNVIILTSTVIALGFGSIFNLLIRQFVLLEEVPPSPLIAGMRNFIGRTRDGA